MVFLLKWISSLQNTAQITFSTGTHGLNSTIFTLEEFLSNWTVKTIRKFAKFSIQKNYLVYPFVKDYMREIFQACPFTKIDTGET